MSPIRSPSAARSRSNEKRSARSAGLRYVSEESRGIRREKQGRSSRYVTWNGKVVHDQKTLDRIRALAIPPAWTDVWICSSPNGHLQATGRDARGRKQYRYHQRWREVRDQNKYDRLIQFAHALPLIRKRVAAHLRQRGLTRKKVLATIVKLLETTLIRVGNDEYATNNDSFGLTTMRDRHVEIKKDSAHFEFKGKSGIRHEIDLENPQLARIMKKCQDLPGQRLFQFVDDDGHRHEIGSSDVNEYLQDISGQEFTAKDFRTWAGTTIAAQALREFQSFDSEAAAKRNVTKAIESVAERLGNTTAVSRKCYVHPAIVDAYLDRSLLAAVKKHTADELHHSLHRLPAEEAVVLALLERRATAKLGSRS